MYKNRSILVTVCARGGSKGIPRKNIKNLCGKPLIVYTLEQAKRFNWKDKIVVSTEDREIKRIAEDNGIEVPFLRSKELATDSASKIPAIIHAAGEAEKYWKEKYDIILDLSPTAPLRTVEDIELAVGSLVVTPNTDAVISASLSSDNPYFNLFELDKKGYAHLSKKPAGHVMRRQDSPSVYALNGSIYCIWKNVLLKERSFFTNKTRIYVMPKERSVDIDNNFDFELTEFLMRKQGEK